MLQTGGLLNAFGNGVVLPFLIIYLHNVRGISLGVAGLAAATQSATALASGFLAGTLSDRIGPKRVLVGALGVMTVAFALMPFIRSPWQAFAVYVVWGAGSGSFWPSQSALLAALTPPARRSPAYALQRLTMNLGAAIGGVAAGLIASVAHPSSFTVLFLVNCATYVAYMLVLARVRTPELHPERARGTWRAVARDRTFLAYAALNAAFMTAAISLMIELLPAFGKNVTHVNEQEVGIIFALDAIGIVIFQLPVAKLAEGRRRMRGLAVMGVIWAVVADDRVGGRRLDDRDGRSRDARGRDARLRARRVPARRDPCAARRRPRAAAARRPLPRALEPLVAGRLDHRPAAGGFMLAARAARALARCSRRQPRLRGRCARARTPTTGAHADHPCAGLDGRGYRGRLRTCPCWRQATPSVQMPSLPRIRTRRVGAVRRAEVAAQQQPRLAELQATG